MSRGSQLAVDTHTHGESIEYYLHVYVYNLKYSLSSCTSKTLSKSISRLDDRHDIADNE